MWIDINLIKFVKGSVIRVTIYNPVYFTNKFSSLLPIIQNKDLKNPDSESSM